MFVIFFGSDTSTTRLRKAGVRECPACLRRTPFSLLFEYGYGHVYFLFGLVRRRRYLIRCDECGNTWPADAEDIGDVRELPPHAIPFLRRWGCLTFVLGGLIAAAAAFALLVWTGERLGEQDRLREQKRLEDFHRRHEERMKEAKEQPKPPADEP